jgi:hypothetical protein
MHTIQPQRLQSFHYYRADSRQIDRLRVAEAGFTLSEVILAILITTLFVSVGLQGMVVAMLLKSKALHIAEANRWVQADIEQIRSQLTLAQVPISTNRARCHPASADLGFADLVRDNLAGGNVTGVADYQLLAVAATSQTGKTFQIDRIASIPIVPENTQAKILGIEYTVTPRNGVSSEQPILHFYTEVIADAAFQCQ